MILRTDSHVWNADQNADEPEVAHAPTGMQMDEWDDHHDMRDGFRTMVEGLRGNDQVEVAALDDEYYHEQTILDRVCVHARARART